MQLYNLCVAIPSPPPSKGKQKGGNIYENMTQIMLYDVTLLCGDYNDFLLVNRFVDSFMNCDWLEMMVFFHTNKQDGEQSTFMVNYANNRNL